MNETTYISLDFYDEFQCIGNDCNSNCCAVGWNIPIDDETYQKYQDIRGRFGQFVRRNLYDKDGLHLIRMNEKNNCPFLNEDNLCNLYIQYGDDYMSETCTEFPRRFLNYDQIKLQSYSLSCEEVLRILYDKPDSVKLKENGLLNETSEKEKSLLNLCKFLSWGMDFVQNPSIPFGKALSALLYIGMNNTGFYCPDDTEMKSCLAQIPDTLNEFTIARQNIGAEELEQTAWQLIFVIADAFCLTVKECGALNPEEFIWDDTFFSLSDEERKQKLYNCWKKRSKDSKHLTFMRRIAATLLFSDGMALSVQSPESIFIQKIANYIILAEVLPSAWNPEYQTSQKQYATGLSLICRIFDQSHVVDEFIYPTICDLVQPDVLTYAMVFMVLFDE